MPGRRKRAGPAPAALPWRQKERPSPRSDGAKLQLGLRRLGARKILFLVRQRKPNASTTLKTQDPREEDEDVRQVPRPRRRPAEAKATVASVVAEVRGMQGLAGVISPSISDRLEALGNKRAITGVCAKRERAQK